jgi:hypothetical protein
MPNRAAMDDLLFFAVFKFLDSRTLLACAMNTRTRLLVRDNSLWRPMMRSVYESDYHEIAKAPRGLEAPAWLAEYKHRAGAVRRFLQTQMCYGSV